MTINSLIQRYSKTREIRSVAIYTFSNFFNKGVSFLFLLYFTKVLSQADFGMLSLFSNSILFIMPFISLGILQSVNADFFKLSKENFRNFFTTSFIMPACVTMLVILLLLIFGSQLQIRYNFPSMFGMVIPVIAFFLFIYELMIILLRNNQQPLMYLWVSAGRLFLEIGVAFFLITTLGFGWQGRILGLLMSYLLLALYAVYYFNKNGYLFGNIERKYLKNEVVYSVPIIAMQAGVFCLSYSGVYYITWFTKNLEAVGIYSVAATFASLVSVFSMALIQYVQPKLYSLLAQKIPDYAAIKKLFVFYLSSMAVFTLIIVSILPVVYHGFLKQNYLPGLQYCYLICTGQFLWSIAYFFFCRLMYDKQKKKLLALSLSAIAFSVCCNWMFTNLYGAKGAALAAVTAYSAILILAGIFNKPFLQKLFRKNKLETSPE